MPNKLLPLAFGTWVSGRRGGLRGLLATFCLTAAAVLALTQALSRHPRSCGGSHAAAGGSYSQKGEDAWRIVDDRWKADLAEKLDEILSRISDEVSPFGRTSE